MSGSVVSTLREDVVSCSTGWALANAMGGFKPAGTPAVATPAAAVAPAVPPAAVPAAVAVVAAVPVMRTNFSLSSSPLPMLASVATLAFAASKAARTTDAMAVEG
jgi:hypothetical protein